MTVEWYPVEVLQGPVHFFFLGVLTPGSVCLICFRRVATLASKTLLQNLLRMSNIILSDPVLALLPYTVEEFDEVALAFVLNAQRDEVVIKLGAAVKGGHHLAQLAQELDGFVVGCVVCLAKRGRD